MNTTIVAKEKAIKYPISELFTSVQGEGIYSGVRMTFIRLAGCTVGKPFPKERYTKLPHCEYKCEGGDPDMGHGPNCAYAKSTNTVLPVYTECCTLYDGRKFCCDTDYRVKERMDIENILSHVPENIKHICISGGEPFMHNLDEFYFKSGKAMIHIETSGTIPISKAFPEAKDFAGGHFHNYMWITVSPKFGVLPEMIKRANEIKLLVDENFTPDKLLKEVMDHETVFLQPVNGEHTINPANLKLCRDWQIKFPQFRISFQGHKILEHFIGERVL